MELERQRRRAVGGTGAGVGLFGFKTHFCPEQSYIHLTSAKGVIVFHTNGWKAKIAYKVSCVRTQGLHVEGAQEMLTW